MAASAKTYKVTFLPAPQAKDDLFIGTDSANEELLANLNSRYLLDVLANDLGGNAAKLFSVDSQSLLLANLSLTSDGQISYEIDQDAFASFQSAAKGTEVTDTFSYTIRLGNGTFSTATATVKIEAVNHAATFSGDLTTSVAEDVLPAAGTAYTTRGKINVVDSDAGESHISSVTPTALIGTVPSSSVGASVFLSEGVTTFAGRFGSFTLTKDGDWTYLLDNTDATIDAMNTGDIRQVDGFTFTTVDCTSSNVTINIDGHTDAPAVRAPLKFSFENNLDGWTAYGAAETFESELNGAYDATDGMQAVYFREDIVSGIYESGLDLKIEAVEASGLGSVFESLSASYDVYSGAYVQTNNIVDLAGYTEVSVDYYLFTPMDLFIYVGSDLVHSFAYEALQLGSATYIGGMGWQTIAASFESTVVQGTLSIIGVPHVDSEMSENIYR